MVFDPFTLSIVGGILAKKAAAAGAAKGAVATKGAIATKGAVGAKSAAAHSTWENSRQIAHTAHSFHHLAANSSQVLSWWTAHASTVAAITGGVALGASATAVVEKLAEEVDAGRMTEYEARERFKEYRSERTSKLVGGLLVGGILGGIILLSALTGPEECDE